MYIVYVCILAPLLVNGLSPIEQEINLNSLSSYEALDDNSDSDIWNVVDFEEISKTQLEKICKGSNSLVYIKEEDLTIDCASFNKGEEPIEVAQNRIKRDADEFEGSGSEPEDETTPEAPIEKQEMVQEPESEDQQNETTLTTEESSTTVPENENEPQEPKKQEDEVDSPPIVNSEDKNETPAENITTEESSTTVPENENEQEPNKQEDEVDSPPIVNSEDKNETAAENITTEESSTTVPENENEQEPKKQEDEVDSPPIVNSEDKNETAAENITNSVNNSNKTADRPEDNDRPVVTTPENNEPVTKSTTVEVPQTEKIKENVNSSPPNGQEKEVPEGKDETHDKNNTGKSLISSKVPISENTKTGESSESTKTAGSKDTTILVFLFVAVVVVGGLAFGYNFIQKRKRQSADLERIERAAPIKTSLQNLAKTENVPEKEPLMDGKKEVEMVDMKKHNTIEESSEETPSEPTVKT